MKKNNQSSAISHQPLAIMRHSCEHVLHQAMTDLFPGLKRAMGPATAEGFYHDFDYANKVTEADFPKIEKRMKEIIKADLPIIRQEISLAEARKLFKGNEYKQEWLDEIALRQAQGKKEKVIIYWAGEPGKPGSDVDLCKGPHIQSTGKIGPFKLLSIAGAYWHGDEKNKMLTRIYGTCFPDQKQLDQYLWQIEEAKKRDHRLLGKKLGLFIISEQVGPGLVIWTPKGAFIRMEIEKLIVDEQTKRGYQHVYSPHIGKKSLWQTSGHWQLYRDKMYSAMKIDDEDYLVKPMNCPMHMMVYQSQPRSYRDLPLRIAENATVYRYEQSGELAGMLRVRYITQDDAHIFCREDQLVSEFIGVVDYLMFLLKIFSIKDFYLRLSIRDPKNKNKYLGNDQIWNAAETKITQAVKKAGLKPKICEGEAAFYGPKLDLIIKDSLGREWQCGTIQLDFMLASRFKLEYTDKDGQPKTPAIIHRAPLGALERWMAILIEHFGGAFPAWLAPVQAVVIPISEKQLVYAQTQYKALKDQNIRGELDDRSQSMQKKIRDAEEQKIPYMLIIGAREVTQNLVSVRQRGEKDLGTMPLTDFLARLKREIDLKQ